MAYRDPDGNLVSADSIDATIEYSQERIAEEKANPACLQESTVVLPVQINGKTRGTIQVEEACTEEDAFRLASLGSKLSKFFSGKSIKKRICVPGKILNVILDAQNIKVGQQ